MRRLSHGKDRGAALVEFAIVVPVLLTFIFAVIEFGWAYSQNLDVRHGAREAGRLAVVNFGTGAGTDQAEDLIHEACARMDEFGDTTVALDQDGTAPGSRVTVTVTRPLDTLTGFLDFALGGKTLDSTVTMRAERDLTWADETEGCSP